jgi:pyruvate dehydrogenase complex dehydrogenase (E1) component
MGDGEMDEPESLGAVSLAGGGGTARQSHLCYQLQFAAQAIFVAVSAPKMISTLKK